MYTTTFQHKFKVGEKVYIPIRGSEKLRKGSIKSIEYNSEYGIRYWIKIENFNYSTFVKESEISKTNIKNLIQ